MDRFGHKSHSQFDIWYQIWKYEIRSLGIQFSINEFRINSSNSFAVKLLFNCYSLIYWAIKYNIKWVNTKSIFNHLVTTYLFSYLDTYLWNQMKTQLKVFIKLLIHLNEVINDFLLQSFCCDSVHWNDYWIKDKTITYELIDF